MNFRNYKVVKFYNGKYGLRRGWIYHTYMDFTSDRHWWSLGSYDDDIMCDDLTRVVNYLKFCKPKVIEFESYE